MTVTEVAEVVGNDMLQRNYQIPDELSAHYDHVFKSRDSEIQSGDEFCAIRIGDTTIALHFRNGKLINCRPDIDFGDPETMVAGIAG